MASLSRRGLYATLLLITGCFGGGGGSCNLFPPNGLAGNGSFEYECVGSGADIECENRAFDLEADLPSRPIARTAQFRMRFVDEPNAVVQPASTNAVSRGLNGVFVAQRAGSIGFFVEARNGTDDIEDAVRLRVVDPDRVAISRIATAMFGDEQLRVGVTQRFRVTASQAREPLAGAVPGTWQVEPQGIVELETEPFGTCTLNPIAPGKITLRATAAGLSDSITIDVLPSAFGFDSGVDGHVDDDAATDASADATDGGLNDASQD
jgi:hypothetical protein